MLIVHEPDIEARFQTQRDVPGHGQSKNAENALRCTVATVARNPESKQQQAYAFRLHTARPTPRRAQKGMSEQSESATTVCHA